MRSMPSLSPLKLPVIQPRRPLEHISLSLMRILGMGGGAPYAPVLPEFSVIGLREHKPSNAGYNPDVTFVDAATNNALVVASTVISRAYGRVFISCDPTWLDNKYIRWVWRAYSTAAMYFVLLLYDGEYDRTVDTDFPNESDIPLKGNGLLQTLQTRIGSFTTVTDDVQVDASGASLPKVTLMWRMTDWWVEHEGNFWLEDVEFNEGAGGVGNLYSIHFDTPPVGPSVGVVMERTATIKDYGYYDEDGWPPAQELQFNQLGDLEDASTRSRSSHTSSQSGLDNYREDFDRPGQL